MLTDQDGFQHAVSRHHEFLVQLLVEDDLPDEIEEDSPARAKKALLSTLAITSL